MDILAKLFGSKSKVKVLRLFLWNPDEEYSLRSVTSRTKVPTKTVRRILSNLEKIDFVTTSKGPDENSKSKRNVVKWALNESFPLIYPLRDLLTNNQAISDKDLARRFKGLGTIKLLVVSGIFVQIPDSRIDLLIAGEQLKKRGIAHAIKSIEAEIGRELSYSLFPTEEYIYRRSINDRLMRDIFDYPHREVVNKIKHKK